jgi:ATP-dependent Clp protease adapter protein ClpS
MMKQSILILLAYFATAYAFTTNPSIAFRSPTALYESEKEGGAAIAKPKVGVVVKETTKQKQKQVFKKKNKASDPHKRREDEFQDAPLYKVMLIGDASYDQAHVVEKMCEIMEDMDENQAASVYKSAQQSGSAMCGKYPLEHAEMYKEQLVRSDPMIYGDVEEDNK